MASKSRIKGITIELDGETTGLERALKDVTTKSIDLQGELRDVDRLLKFDPGNVEALAQKQKILTQQIENTTEKLNRLKAAQDEVEKQYQSGDIAEKQYRAFRREIEYTEKSLDKLKTNLKAMDDTPSIQNVKKEMTTLDSTTEEASESVKDLGSELVNLTAGAAAVGSVGEAVEKALEVSSNNTKISISMDLDEESTEVVKEAINQVSAYGVDAEEALEGIRRQWALNKDATNESNQAVIEGAGAIASAYSGIDFTELIQETNEISKALNIGNEETLGLINSLLKVGFPPEQLDIIAEYGTQLSAAGYNAEEIQAIFEAGINTGTWNIDNLLDGLKEGRIKLAEFGQEVPKATAELLEGTSISTQQLQEWGKAVAKGGEDGKKAMQDVAKALASVEDDTTRNTLGVQFFGTMWEDQGTNITDTLLNMNDYLTTAKDNQEKLNDATEKLNSDPAVAMKQAMFDIQTALAPLLVGIAEIVGKIAQWIQENTTLAATITAIVSVLGILTGIFMGLAPIITALTALTGTLGVSIGAIAAPIGIIIGAITALIAIGVALYKNWDEIKAKCTEVWNEIKDFLNITWENIKNIFNKAVDFIVTFVIDKFDWAINDVIDLFDGFKSYFSGVWDFLKNLVLGTMLVILDIITGNWNKVLSHTKQIWENIKNSISTAIGGVKQIISSILSLISGIWLSAWNGLENVVSNAWRNIKTIISNMASEIVNTFKNIDLYSIGRNIIQGLINGVKSMASGLVNSVKGVVDGAIEGAKNLLGIHSPSRVFMEIGEYTGEGFVNGIKSMTNQVAKAGQKMADASLPTIKAPKLQNSMVDQETILYTTNNTYLDSKLISRETTKQVISSINKSTNNYRMGKGGVGRA